jgi:nitrogen regulatory protein P-II 1
MKKLEIITRPEKVEDLKDILDEIGITGMTVYNVLGCGAQRGFKEYYRGTELSINLLPKIKFEIVMEDDMLDSVIDKVTKSISTGNVGDGKIFVYNVEDSIKIRTGERGL